MTTLRTRCIKEAGGSSFAVFCRGAGVPDLGHGAPASHADLRSAPEECTDQADLARAGDRRRDRVRGARGEEQHERRHDDRGQSSLGFYPFQDAESAAGATRLQSMLGSCWTTLGV